MPRPTLVTVVTAAATSFCVAALAAPAQTPAPVPSPKHCSVKQCPTQPELASRVKALEAQMFGLRAFRSCVSGLVIPTDDVQGHTHPLIKWKMSCVQKGWKPLPDQSPAPMILTVN